MKNCGKPFFCAVIFFIFFISIKAYSASFRIASLAPGITETLYELDLGDKVIAVTQFCNWPQDAAKKTKVGGFLNINLEKLAETDANFAIIPEDMNHFKETIENLGIRAVTFNSRNINSFFKDVEKLGKIFDREKKAQELICKFKTELGRIKTDKRPSVLFAIINAHECFRPVSNISIIGKDGFYDNLIFASGGINIWQNNLEYPLLSLESILALDPDLIIISAPECKNTDAIASFFQNINAKWSLKNGSLLFLTDYGDTIPGPRSLLTLRKLENFILQYAGKKKNAAGN